MHAQWIKNPSLADDGRRRIGMAESLMPVLRIIRQRYADEKPLKGVTVAACLHVTKETAVLIRTLKDGGATVVVSASNPLSTQDEVAAALASEGFPVYAYRGMSSDDYYRAIGASLSHRPQITVDDGADLVTSLHKVCLKRLDDAASTVARVLGDSASEILRGVWGGTEETTTGVIRIKSLEAEGLLAYPIIAVNDARCKSLFDNPLGTGQSTIDGMLRSTNILLAGKNIVVCGYGRVGSGIAERARGMGGRVTIVEPDPIKALQAYMNGYNVTTMLKAAEYGEIFITATGNIRVIRREHFERMRDGAILANAGHMDVEIDKAGLARLATSVESPRAGVTVYRLSDGRRIMLLGEGRLVNLVCGEGHPSEVMDLSFSIQAESIRYIAERHAELEKRVYQVPAEVDIRVAHLKLRSIGVEIEELTEEQKAYVRSWAYGT
ncbi:MAG: adenosylhomocysteinase [Nitrososphaerota archaeon]